MTTLIPAPDGDWTLPGCHPVAEGVHRVVLPMPQDGLRAVNVYVVDGEDGVDLVDAGWRVPGAVEVLAAGLAEIGRTLDDVRNVYVTHVHRDHYTLGPEIRRAARGVRLHLGREERAGLEAISVLGNNDPVSAFRELRRAGAEPLAERIAAREDDRVWEARDWEAPDEWLDPGPVRLGAREVEAVPTPGHTKGHLAFHDLEAGLLFAGDHVLPTITPSIGFELGDWEMPLGQYLASLELLLQRPDATLLPAHGMPGGSVHARVRELLAHHDRRFAATLAAFPDDREIPGIVVAERLGWTRRERPFVALDDFNRMIAVCETMAHLDVLVQRGELRVSELLGVDMFRRA